jgi:hypothetical protein
MLKPIYSFAQIADYLVTGYWAHFGTTPPRPATNVITFSVSHLSPESQNLAKAALQTWQDAANLSFVESANPALTFREDDRGAYGGPTSVNVSAAENGAVFGSYIGSKTFNVYIHEIGHALGLGHPGPYNGGNTYSTDTTVPGDNIFLNDTHAYSAMSYNPQDRYDGSQWRSNSTPMVADILAVETIYGRAAATRTGDTVYGFNTNAGPVYDFSLQPLTYVNETLANGFSNNKGPPAFTIVDRGGNDTLDGSGYTGDQTIDLSPGAFSSMGLIRNIAIDLNTVLENAIGGSGNDQLIGNFANNGLRGGRGNDTLDGGNGTDTALFSGAAAEYLWSRTGSGVAVSDKVSGRDGSDTTNTERLRFSDKVVAFDVEENAGQAYRLYQAALHRTPDTAGLSYWVNAIDHGASLAQVAGDFIRSAEFAAAFGNPTTLSNAQFLNVIYTNILGRSPDAAGLGYWLGELDRGFGRDRTLASFSESVENKAIVGSTIATGIVLDAAWLT